MLTFLPTRWFCVALCVVVSGLVHADMSPTILIDLTGQFDYFMTGTALAVDTDSDQKVDALSLPAAFDVTSANVPAGAVLVHAYLYWGGTQTETSGPDTSISITVPGNTQVPVVADECYLSDGGSTAYDMHMCRTEITSILTGGPLVGTYAVDDYSGLIANNGTDNASASLLLVYSDGALSRGRLVIHDGLLTMSGSSQNINITGISAYSTPSGSLTYYTMEGDTGISGVEQLTVTATPSGGSMSIPDSMDHTINTVIPSLTDAIGVDIDRYDIGAVMTAGDSVLDIDYTAGTDKWWLGVNAVRVSTAYTDTEINQLINLSGSIGYFMTGVPLAIDTNANNRVDAFELPASFDVSSADIISGAVLEQAYLYWGGTATEHIGPDKLVSLTVPGGGSQSVSADTCYSSDGGSQNYDMHVCRADITAVLAGSSLVGTYSVDDYSGLVFDGSADNASASLLLVYSELSLAHANVFIHDGMKTLTNSSINIALSGYTLSSSPTGTLTYHTMEGDSSGSGIEQLSVTSSPSAGSVTIPDSMDSTINTSVPVQTDTIGVDIDRHDISSALSGSDTLLSVDYSAGSDKWWMCVNTVHLPTIGVDSDGDGLLDGTEDRDGDGIVDSGETDPQNPDTDADGLSDGLEDYNANRKVDPGETDPLNADTDDDGLADGIEDRNANRIVDIGETDPLSPDSDNDGLFDGIEDSNANGVVDPGELDPLNPDTDGDNALDGEEDLNGNGIVDAGEADPLDPDTDDDGLTDGYEIKTSGTAPDISTAVNTGPPGDLNDDGQINAGDLILLYQEILGGSN